MGFDAGSRLPVEFSERGTPAQTARLDWIDSRKPSPNCERAWKRIIGTAVFKKPKNLAQIFTYKDAKKRQRLVRNLQTLIRKKSVHIKPKTRGTKLAGGFLKRKSASALDIHRYLWLKHKKWASIRSVRRDMR